MIVNDIDRGMLSVALTSTQVFAGVTYNSFTANAVVATELFLVLRTAQVSFAALIINFADVMLCVRESRRLDLLMTWIGFLKVGQTPTTKV